MNKSQTWSRPDVPRGGIAAAAYPTSRWGPTPGPSAPPTETRPAASQQVVESTEERLQHLLESHKLEDPGVSWLELVEAYSCPDRKRKEAEVKVMLAKAQASQWTWELYELMLDQENEDYFMDEDSDDDPGIKDDDDDCAVATTIGRRQHVLHPQVEELDD